MERFEQIEEIENLKNYLAKDNVYLENSALIKAILLPEEIHRGLGAVKVKYPSPKTSLMNNPFSMTSTTRKRRRMGDSIRRPRGSQLMSP